MARINDPEKGVTQLTGTPEEIAPAIQSASDYAARTQERRKQLEEAKAGKRPLGGAPPIPAGKLNALLPKPDFGGEEASPFEVQQPPPSPPPPPMGGVGSAYAANQAMARGELHRPINLGQAKQMEQAAKQPPKAGLSQETVQLLQHQQQAQQQAQLEEATTKKEELENTEAEIADSNKIDIADLPFDLIGQRRMDLIYNDRRRKEIESRLEPLDVADLITKREIQQRITIIPGKLVYQMRTLSESELLFCLQYVYEFPGSTRYVEELLNMARLVCGLVSVNGAMLPDHRDNVGKLSEAVVRDRFDKKFKVVTLYPSNLIADLGAQFHWFIERVNQLFSVDALKNG